MLLACLMAVVVVVVSVVVVVVRVAGELLLGAPQLGVDEACNWTWG